MSQLTVYIDEETRKKIEVASKRANLSVSKWVKLKLTHAIENEWPEDYFELFGSLSDDELSRPQELSLDDNLPRESF